MAKPRKNKGKAADRISDPFWVKRYGLEPYKKIKINPQTFRCKLDECPGANVVGYNKATKWDNESVIYRCSKCRGECSIPA